MGDRILHTNEVDLDTIEAIMKLTVAAESFEELAQMIVEKCADLLHADSCTLWRRVREEGQDKLILGAGKGFQRKPGEEIPKYDLNWDAKSDGEINGVTACIAIRREPRCFITYEDLSKHPAHRGYWDKIQWDNKAEAKFGSMIGIPLIIQNEGNQGSSDKNRVVGVLKLEKNASKERFSRIDFSLAKNLAPFIAIALEAMNVREAQEEHRQRILSQLTTSLLRPFEPPVLYEQIVGTTARLLDADLCSLWLCNSDKSALKLAAAYGIESTEEDAPIYDLNLHAKADRDIKGLTAWVAIRNRPFYARYFEDLLKHPSWKGYWDKPQWYDNPQDHFSSLYAVPLVIKDEILGVLKIERRQPKPPFSDINRAIFDLMADFIKLSLELGSRLRQDIAFDFFHILKQPMSTSRMAFDDLRRELSRPGGPRGERLEKRLNQMEKNLETARGISNNAYLLASESMLSNESIIETPKNFNKINLKNLIQNILDDITVVFQDLTYEISEDLSSYTLNLLPNEKKKFEVILWNIFSNSAKYSRSEAIPEIKVSIRQNSDTIEIILEDNGQGISPGDLPYIFKPNFTRGTKDWPDSLGVGLTTVDRLLKGFNWDKKVESIQGKGTKFIIIIPKDDFKVVR